MAHPERPSYLPELPTPWPRPPDYLPAASEVAPTSVLVPHASAVGAPAEPSGIPQEARPTPPPRSQEGSPQPERQRVTLAGRLGASPSFRTTPKGQLLGRFPLAVHDEDSTRWVQVLAFGQRAEKLRDETRLAKGEQVEVIGYPHPKHSKGKDGKTRVEVEVYATVIRRT